ncbi:hypothetical protein D3C87_1963760 [compost metagenome]
MQVPYKIGDFEGIVGVELNADAFVSFARFGGNNDGPVFGARAVQGSGGGPFEDGHFFHIVRVDTGYVVTPVGVITLGLSEFGIIHR